MEVQSARLRSNCRFWCQNDPEDGQSHADHYFPRVILPSAFKLPAFSRAPRISRAKREPKRAQESPGEPLEDKPQLDQLA